GRRMPRGVGIDRLPRVGAGNPFDHEVEDGRNGRRAAHPTALDLDRLGLRAGELPDERCEGGHRAAALAARDRRERLALLLRRALVQEEADRPVALDHRAGRVQEYGEAESVERATAVATTLNLEHKAGVAHTLGRTRRQARRRTRTHRVAVARLKILAVDLPLNVGHHTPPLTTSSTVTSPPLAPPPARQCPSTNPSGLRQCRRQTCLSGES